MLMQKMQRTNTVLKIYTAYFNKVLVFCMRFITAMIFFYKITSRFELGPDKTHIALLVFSEEVRLEFGLDTLVFYCNCMSHLSFSPEDQVHILSLNLHG